MTRVAEQLAFEDKLAAEAREHAQQEEYRLARSRLELRLTGQWAKSAPRGAPVLTKIVCAGDISDIKELAAQLGAKVKAKGTLTFAPCPVLLQALITEYGLHADDQLMSWLRAQQQHVADLLTPVTSSEPCSRPKFRALYPYQRSGAQFLRTAKRAILADDRGLGKTATALLAAETTNTLQPVRRVLVVVPTYLKANWADEIRKWTSAAYYVAEGSRKQRDANIDKYLASDATYCIVNYEMLRKQKGTLGYTQLFKQRWDTIIFDEAHRLKSRSSQWTLGAFALQSEQVFFLTGTPLMNKNPAELWPMLHIIDPIRWSAYWQFVDRFCLVTQSYFGWQISGGKNQDQLKEVLAATMLRRTKQDVLPELPPKIYQTIEIPLELKHQRLYKKAEKELLLELPQGEAIPVGSALALITRLRQLATYPAVLGIQDYQPKTPIILELLSDILAAGEQVVLFGWYKEYLYHLQTLFTSKKWHSEIITGEISLKSRTEIQERFRSGKTRILIGNMAAAGEGLNFENASTAILVELDWVPARNEQTEDRVHRMTTTQSPTIIRLVSKGTIDEDILRVVHSKKKFIEEALNLSAVMTCLLERKGSKGSKGSKEPKSS